LLNTGFFLLHDQAETADRTNALMKLSTSEIFHHPPYSPDLVPSDFHLFTMMKFFHTNEDVMDEVKIAVYLGVAVL